ncbi:MAG: hypothetical protein LUG18_01455 [Candidatus Azobacteroides sp.]|nr:hypothetical protein [Candidatus Azobacteroides sp.]
MLLIKPRYQPTYLSRLYTAEGFVARQYGMSGSWVYTYQLRGLYLKCMFITEELGIFINILLGVLPVKHGKIFKMEEN